MDALAGTNDMQKDFYLLEVLHEKSSELYNVFSIMRLQVY